MVENVSTSRSVAWAERVAGGVSEAGLGLEITRVCRWLPIPLALSCSNGLGNHRACRQFLNCYFMAMQRYTVTPRPIKTLLTLVKSGEIALSEIKPFFWEATEVRNLIDSLFRD